MRVKGSVENVSCSWMNSYNERCILYGLFDVILLGISPQIGSLILTVDTDPFVLHSVFDLEGFYLHKCRQN